MAFFVVGHHVIFVSKTVIQDLLVPSLSSWRMFGRFFVDFYGCQFLYKIFVLNLSPYVNVWCFLGFHGPICLFDHVALQFLLALSPKALRTMDTSKRVGLKVSPIAPLL